MTRDEAVKIAAKVWPNTPHDANEWADAVLARADALLAAMGEPKAGTCWHEWTSAGRGWICRKCQATSTQLIPIEPDAIEPDCCAATEARVVAEISEWCRRYGGTANWIALPIERGDWRAREAGDE